MYLRVTGVIDTPILANVDSLEEFFDFVVGQLFAEACEDFTMNKR
jgi:hypothetical protein